MRRMIGFDVKGSYQVFSCFLVILTLAMMGCDLQQSSSTLFAKKAKNSSAKSTVMSTSTTPSPRASSEQVPVVYDGTKALGAPFVDNMILQREMQVPVWGWTTPGSEVSVSFGGKVALAVAGGDGKWMATLPELKASFVPREMVISFTGGEKTTLKNVLVGEVWMASGQSNMQWKVGKCNVLGVATSFKEKLDEKGIKVAPIREFEITSVYAMLHPIEKASGAWKNGKYEDYSAIAFAFAQKLYGELNVPIGILNCSFSQTPIQAWIPRDGFRDGKDSYTKGKYQKVLETDPSSPEHKAAWRAFYEDLEAQMVAVESKVAKGEEPSLIKPSPPGNLKGNRDSTWLYNGRLHGVVPYAIKGAIWNQGYANANEGFPYYHNLHSLVRGWRMVWERPNLPVYFHQFYSASMKHAGKENNNPVMGGAAEMRLGTWLARDIPNTGMASQIDISGAIHYRAKTVPGQRLARHALKNQYGQKTLVVDGPMYKNYKIKGHQLIVEFENADEGLVVGETGSHVLNKKTGGFANPKLIENGDAEIKLFYLAGEDRIWHPASMKINGSKVVLTSPNVKAPRGVSYASAGVGWQANLYNKAMLPATPFIFYDHEMVLKKSWPDEKLKVVGVEIDPNSVGQLYEYRKMPILSTQFRDKAVLQADKSVTIWGSAVHDWGHEADGEAVIHFSFGKIKKTIPVVSGMREWNVILPPMKAGKTPYTLKVSLTIDGEVVHERVAEGIVFGDVWYVGAPGLQGKDAKWDLQENKPSGQIVRMIERQANRSKHTRPSRFSVAVSTTPKNRFASYWKEAKGPAANLGHRLAAKSGRPIGIIWMQTVVNKSSANPELKSWVPPEYLNQTPSLMEDYKIIGSQYPSNPYYLDNIKRYVSDWKSYWSEYIPEMMASKKVPDGKTWGGYPSTVPSAKSSATQTYNVLVNSFAPTSLRGIVFLAGDTMGKEGQRENFGAEMSTLANGLKEKFGEESVPFIYTQPSSRLAPGITPAKGIKGESKAVEVNDWTEISKVIEAAASL